MMDGVGRGLGQAIFTIAIGAFVIGASIIGGISWIMSDGDEIESYESTLKPVEWRLEVNDKKIDTIYIYKVE